ncbi:hypothetical protein [Nocardiopsis coralliicola]
MRLTVTLAASVAVWVLGTAVLALTLLWLVPTEHLLNPPGMILWTAVPLAAISAALVLTAAAVHRHQTPAADLTAAAALAPPSLGVVCWIILQLSLLMPAYLLAAQTLCCATASTAVWLVIRRIQNRSAFRMN